MSLIEQIGVHVIATLFQLPFHLLIASPWLVAAAIIASRTRDDYLPRQRLVLVSGVAAAGLAPAYGAHLSMVPAFVLVLFGGIDPLSVAISFFGTWGFIVAVGLAVMWLLSHKGPPGPNPSINTDAAR